MRRVAAAAVVLWATAAGAVELETRIQIEDEEDLYELLATEDISQETFDSLIEILQDKVDLCTDDSEAIYSLPNLNYDEVEKIVKYRQEAASIPDPGALAATGVLEEWKAEALRPFLLPCGSMVDRSLVSGVVRAMVQYTSGDDRVPASLIDAKLRADRHFTGFAAVFLTRNRVGDVRYDASRDALSATEPETRLIVPKFFVQYADSDLQLVLGTYRAGFGQRLTFDTTRAYTPNGIRGDDNLYRGAATVRSCYQFQGELPAAPCPSFHYVTPDFTYQERLTGVAAGLKHLPAGDGWLQLYAFGSYQVHSIYQYEIYDRRTCTDPTDDSNPACSAPTVYRRQDNLLAPTSTFGFQTLPAMWAEPLGGANVTYFFDRHSHLGVTGYASSPQWLVSGMDLDFQEWSRFPYGGAFGAVGVDGSLGIGDLVLNLEVTRSFDGTPQGGGFGAISRNTLSFDKQELELSLRYYDQSFKNPYARAIADPDEVDGVTARDEAGARIRYTGEFDRRLRLRGLADFYVQPSTNTPKVRVRGRVDYDFTEELDAGAWVEWKDKNLQQNTGLQCYEVSFETVEGEPVPCTGSRLKAAVHLGYDPMRRMRFELQGQIATVDDPTYPDSQRQDASVWLKWRWAITNNLIVKARVRYANEALDVSNYLEDTIWGYADVVYRLPRTFLIRAHYDIIGFLDNRASTMTRDPNPEHWFRLEVQGSF